MEGRRGRGSFAVVVVVVGLVMTMWILSCATVGTAARETKCLWKRGDTGLKTCVTDLAVNDTLVSRCPAESINVPSDESKGCTKELKTLDAKCDAADEASLQQLVPSLESTQATMPDGNGVQFKFTKEMDKTVTLYKSCAEPGAKNGYIFTISFLEKGKTPKTTPTGGRGPTKGGDSSAFRFSSYRTAAASIAAATFLVAVFV